jgi:hypothetical protein
MLGWELDELMEVKGEAEAAMLRESHRHKIARLLEAVPGMGPVRVAQLLPIVITPHRFRTKRQFWSYCGFGIVRRSSSDWVREDGQWVPASVFSLLCPQRAAGSALRFLAKRWDRAWY